MEAQAVAPPPGDDPGRIAGSPPVRTATRRLVADRLARWFVTAGGLAIIASILGILIFIVVEVWPLARGARVAEGALVSLDGATAAAVLTDEYRSHLASLAPDGTLTIRRVADDAVVHERPILDRPGAGADGGPGVTPHGTRSLRGITTAPGQQLFTALTDDGRGVAVPLSWEVGFEGDTRVVTPVVGGTVVFPFDPAAGLPEVYSLRLDDEGAGVGAAQLDNGSLVLLRREVERNLFTEELTESWERFEGAAPWPLTALLLDEAGHNLYGAAASGRLVWWRLVGGRPEPPQVVGETGSPVRALTLLIGDRSLVVGREDGTLEIWFAVRQPDETFRLERVRDFPAMDHAIRQLTPSLRDKGFLALDDGDALGLYYSTSNRVLWTGASPLDRTRALFFAPKADAAVLGGEGRAAFLEVDNPHPEISLRALFGKVWYEGYTEAQHVWQSSSGTDDFEPKLGLTPLLIGTLKGTLYSLILAIPLGVLGAMYTSQFMNPGLKRVVKPTVEIMAALPSVVLGFLAGLWLAPRIEQVFPALTLMVWMLPAIVLVVGFAWRALPVGVRGRIPVGSEALLYVVVLALGIWLCLELNEPFERLAFGGNFQQWLLDATGLRYDQRNAIVVGLAMGFAVIPIIFSIAEDAFSNVPRNLVSGSLALGANRWQTVTRVVLPTASPGIFSAIMIGFGRAVGETMIVLMATGNTPVMDWNPFNGFRTLSANIAVEIPEAPHGGTLYRTLFLAALILFVFTFLINTMAELVRQRLRKRYSEL